MEALTTNKLVISMKTLYTEQQSSNRGINANEEIPEAHETNQQDNEIHLGRKQSKEAQRKTKEHEIQETLIKTQVIKYQKQTEKLKEKQNEFLQNVRILHDKNTKLKSELKETKDQSLKLKEDFQTTAKSKDEALQQAKTQLSK